MKFTDYILFIFPDEPSKTDEPTGRNTSPIIQPGHYNEPKRSFHLPEDHSGI